jgi:hypothetical protein
MLPDYEIEPGRGIGTLLFGIAKNELDAMLGPPDDIEFAEEPGRERWETQLYSAIRCSFSFDPGEGNRLVAILVENGYFHIGKKIRVGLGRDDLLAVASVMKLGDPVTGARITEELLPEESIAYGDSGLEFILESGKISAIILVPLKDDKGKIIWPEQVNPAEG